MVLVNALLLRSSPEDVKATPWGEEGPVQERPEAGPRAGRYREVFRSPTFWIIGTSYALAACSLYIVTTFMVDYANVELGLSFKEASFLATIHGISQVVGVLTIPMLSDRVGRKLTIAFSNLFIASSIAGIVLVGASTLGLYAAISVLGTFYGVTWPMYGACGGDYFSREVMGTVIGAWTPFYGSGAIFAHLVAGRIRDVTGSFQLAFLLAVALAVVAALLMFRLKPADG